MKLLETRALTIGYPRPGNPPRVLQREVSVHIRPGEIISLMGQNGVGKTTFIRTISGLLAPLGGSVFYQEKPLHTLSGNELAQMLSLVLTEKPVNLNLTVTELVALGRHPYSNWMGILTKKDKEVLEWAIAETHINYLLDKKLYELSDGQLQKVMIARALAQETDLILLDEPAAHLDLYNKIELMMLLRKIAGSGKGILISTHDMQVSTQLSDRLWLFNFNQPLTEGLPEDLILSGALERTLYLQDYGYDMIFGTVKVEAKGPEVHLTGESTCLHWTKQALSRNGFRIAETAQIRIHCQPQHWQYEAGDTSLTFPNIASLLQFLLPIRPL